MSFTDDEEELGYTDVYLCKKCDEDKPRRDFYKGVGQSKIESIYFNTCKDCRDKVKATKELTKGQKTQANHLNYINSNL